VIPINASSGQYDSLQRVPGDTLPAIDFLTMADLHHAVVMEAATGVMIVSASIRPMVTEFVNPAFERITGYTSAEVVGQPPGRLSNNDLDQPGLYELQRAIAAGMPAKVIVRNYRKDGSLFWTNCRSRRCATEQGACRTGSAC
jgi:PAS domain S-box-containing protein